MLFDCRERFADSGSESTGDLTQGVQDVFFSRRLHLLLIKDLSGAAALWRNPKMYWLPRLLTVPSRTAALAVRSQTSRASWRSGAAHPPAGPSNPASAGIRCSETRLRKGDRPSCIANPWRKRPVKDGVARRVHEIGEHNRVFVRESGWARKVEVTSDKERQRQPRRQEPSLSSVW